MSPSHLRVVSGGQTGVDRAALDAAMAHQIPCGGWCPRGRKAEDGPIDEHYPLQETPSKKYSQRTRWNVRDSDGTLIVTIGEPTGGTELTRHYAEQLGRPCHIVDLSLSRAVVPVVKWMEANTIATLNVAGPRESTCPGIGGKAERFLTRLISRYTHAS